MFTKMSVHILTKLHWKITKFNAPKYNTISQYHLQDIKDARLAWTVSVL